MESAPGPDAGKQKSHDFSWLFLLVRPKGFEPLTFCSVDRRSIQLSYGRIFNSVRALRLDLEQLYIALARWSIQ